MAAVNLINPALIGATPKTTRVAASMGLLSKPQPSIDAARRTGNWSPPVIPAGASPEEVARLQALNRQGMVAASQYKAPARPAPTSGATAQYRLPSGQMDEPDVVGAPDEDEANHSKKKKAPMKSKPVTNPSNLGYSQSYDPNGRGYRAINTISPQSAAALRAKFKTPSNLG